jgi:hypothetical protein
LSDSRALRRDREGDRERDRERERDTARVKDRERERDKNGAGSKEGGSGGRNSNGSSLSCARLAPDARESPAGKEHRPVSRSEDSKDIPETSQSRETGRESKRESGGMGYKIENDKLNKFEKADTDVVVGKTRQAKEIKETKEHSVSSTAAKAKSKDSAICGGGGGGKTSTPTGTKEAKKPGKVASDNEIQKHIAAASLSVSKAATSKTKQPSKSTLVIPDCSMPSDDSD